MQEWRIVHGTKGSTLKQLWVRLRSGLWAPTERFICDAQMMPIMGGSPGTVDKQVGASADDGHYYEHSGHFSITDTTQVVGRYDTYIYHVFFRWTGITIEGTIDTSYTQCYRNTAATGIPELKVYGVDEEDPATPTTGPEFVADPLTTAAVDWDGGWGVGWNQSPSLNTIFQELVNDYTISNDAVMVQVKNDKASGRHRNSLRMWDYSGNLYGPKLHIEWSAAGPSPGWNQLQYTSEPPTPNAWNQLKQETGTGDYKKLFYEGE